MKVVLDNALVCSILEKVGGYKNVSGTISFLELYRCLNNEEVNLIRQFLKIDPCPFGFKGEFFGIGTIPDNLIAVKNQKFFLKGRKNRLKKQFVPLPVWLAYWKMNEAFSGETGKRLLINSGYRSPACQVLTFFHYLKLHEFDFLRTMKGVAFPGYSEHGNPKKQALDFLTIDGVPSDEAPNGFEETMEFNWLIKHGRKFGFYLSYPQNNNHGIKFEPWHWRYEGFKKGV